MIKRLARVTILVRDQDEALRFYTQALGLEKKADQRFGPGMRWLTVAPKDQMEVEIVLQPPASALHGEEGAKRMLDRVGQGTTWVFYTDDCRKDYETLRARGVRFTREPQEQPYGIEALFEDLYGNPFSLLQPRQP
jgi:predicted enzyme related to lactoylglutathione lyase